MPNHSRQSVRVESNSVSNQPEGDPFKAFARVPHAIMRDRRLKPIDKVVVCAS